MFRRAFLYFCLIVFLIGFTVFYGKVLIVKAKERTFIETNEAFIFQKKIPLGVDGYGYLRQMKVKVGEIVNEGDVLFTYYGTQNGRDFKPNVETNSENNPDGLFTGYEEIEIRSTVRARVIKQNLFPGSYLTRDDIVLELTTLETTILAKLAISAVDIDKIKIGAKTEVTLPNKDKIEGKVRAIVPQYDTINQKLDIESTLLSSPVGLIPGIPVSFRVYIEDSLGNNIENQVLNTVKAIPFKPLHDYYQV